jgi:hypothetical protein
MRYRKVRVVFYRISTFVNMMLHCCAPAHAEGINCLSIVSTIPGNEAGLDRVSLRRGTQPELSMTHETGRKVIGIRQ